MSEQAPSEKERRPQHHSNRSDKERRPPKTFVEWVSRTLRITLSKKHHVHILIAVWITTATLFYRAWNGWPWSRSFYHSVQAGLSIGFGLYEENDKVSRLFTCGHVLFGTAIAGSALVFLVESAADRIALRIGSSASCTADVSATRFPMQRSTGVFFLLLAVLLTGFTFAVLHEKKDPITALYFAITALSTGGLMAPADHAVSLWFTGAWCIIGVPVFGYALGQLAEQFLVVRVESAVRQSSVRVWSNADFDAADALMTRDGRIDWGEFLELELITSGTVDPDVLRRLKKRFRELDLDGDGHLTRDEIVRSHTASKRSSAGRSGSGSGGGGSSSTSGGGARQRSAQQRMLNV